MIKGLTKKQSQEISGGNNIAIDLDENNFILIPSTSIPKRCARSLEYTFNGLLNKELTTPELYALTMVYGKCTLKDYQLFITNIETVLKEANISNIS